VQKLKYTISARGKQYKASMENFIVRNYQDIALSNIDSVFGFLDYNPFYGGRSFNGAQISMPDVYWMYDNSINLRLPLSNHNFTIEKYNDSKSFLAMFHRAGNSVIITNDTLAEHIRIDFPKYTIEASVIKNIQTQLEVSKALELYDQVILPMSMCVEYDKLNELSPKNKITLFGNARCAFNCPSKMCYEVISDSIFYKKHSDIVSCSKLLTPRPNLGLITFDINRLAGLGYYRFKLLRYT